MTKHTISPRNRPLPGSAPGDLPGGPLEGLPGGSHENLSSGQYLPDGLPLPGGSHEGLPGDSFAGDAFEGDAYSCDCGAELTGRPAAEQHAAEQDLCTACLGSAVEPMVPGMPGGMTRGCTACAATGRRKHQMVWALARAEAERVITIGMVQSVVARFGGPFRLSEVADAVRSGLNLPGGRLPVGPRVRDVLLRLQAAGQITLLSAPDELLDGADVVLYRDPQWQLARTL